ncbi:hypothetical protein GIB67_033386 [Kingdonia uniflora]|uniref:Uncharacterized protein n=1 Tax=Kingdonia uniflora TaxID=39325 RepID=A0A7J7LTX8_9MAGN|nr:hypothetical protein GIB67_033386 [Kingdonia uniflora]
MSQGFVRSTQTRDMEIIGGEYFDDLASRSFFQDLEIDWYGSVSCKMHDLMHDFANFVANNECSIVESVDTKFDYSKTRHLAFEIMESNDSFIPPPILNAKNLRTFFVWVYPNPRPNLDIKLLHHLTCLRTLDLSCVAIETLPNEVGSLIHLRYLDLSETKLVELPESVCNLRNLQTLKLTSCKNLSRLPEGLRKLVNLRHLELLYTDALECLPKGIEELRCLQTLSMFVMSEEGCQLRELSNLNSLCGSLTITNIRGGGSKESINLKSKEHLCCLGLEFVEYEGKRDDDGSAIELFEPHPNLEELVVWYYGGSKFPNWMEFQSSSIMLRRLQITECRNLEILPPWANLESLQCLSLRGLDSMRHQQQ